MEISKSVIMPREDFLEMQEVAYSNYHVPTAKDRVAGTAQATVVFAAMSGAFIGAAWGWAKAMDWLDEKKLSRADRKAKNLHTL